MNSDKVIDSGKVIEKAKQCLQQKQYLAAIETSRSLLEHEPSNIDALYLVAVCHRYLAQTDQALAVLNTLKAAHPRYGRAYQEQGHNLRLTDRTGAIRAYQQAVSLNPALTASWQWLADLYRLENNVTAHQHACEQLSVWSELPRELLSVHSLIYEGSLQKAEKICRFFLQNNPKNTQAMHLLATIGMKHNVFDDAEFLLESCLEFEPDFLSARQDYVKVLHERQKYQKALEQATILCQSAPENLAYRLLFANELQAVGNIDGSVEEYEKILARVPNDSGVLIMLGHAHKTVGKTNDAVAAYRRATQATVHFGDAYWSLANLKTYRFSDDEVDEMRRREEDSGTSEDDRIHLCFSLGKSYEDREAYQQSFHYYQRGNALKKAALRYDADRKERECRAQMEVCTPALFADKKTSGCQDTSPIFIVGLPRAGSTLIEQILSSHSLVDGTMELPNIMALSNRLHGRRKVHDDMRYPKILEELSAEQRCRFGEEFINNTRIFRQGAPYFIDKMPNNFWHIGLIHLILPNAKIIDARRHPMACCFSGYKQLFHSGQEFTYDFDDLGRYYKNYVSLMSHWQSVLPEKILTVQYEEVVGDLETQVRRILAFCGLPFEAACLNFHETARSVRTASSEQVRQPLYKKGLEQWQHFENQLDPLKAALAPLVTYS